MPERFLTRSAVMLFLFRGSGNDREILLQKRFNTGYMDGMWDCSVSGHVEENESMKMAMCREAKEEIGVTIEPGNIHFATITHKHTFKDKVTYYNGYFFAEIFSGNPTVKEPDKCSDLRWININALPQNFIPDRLQALHNYLAGVSYDETGWPNKPLRKLH